MIKKDGAATTLLKVFELSSQVIMNEFSEETNEILTQEEVNERLKDLNPILEKAGELQELIARVMEGRRNKPSGFKGPTVTDYKVKHLREYP